MGHRQFRMGSSYYPERWERERWEVDARLMKDVGMDFIRTGEFAWSTFEPRDGQFDWSWMDEAIAVFAGYGIQTILCTPTASPMPWMYTKHPDMVPVTEDGKPFLPGERRHYCFNNPDFRRYADRVTTAMARHYAGHPDVIGWQIDNELGGEEFICYCAYCRNAFQVWLTAKYGTVNELNRRWGTTFFSLTFTDWSEVPLPMGHNVQYFNPSMKKDHLSFVSDAMKAFLLSQHRILKPHAGKDIPVTTNRFTLFWSDKFDHRMDQELDVIAFDNYDLELSLAAFHHDFYRSLNPVRPYWVLEQHTGLRDFGTKPDEARLQAIQSYLRGAELVCYFSWRQINYGVEQDFYGVVEYDGSPGETYSVIKEAAAWLHEEVQTLERLSSRQDVAILHSYDSSMMYEVNHQFNANAYHRTVYSQFYVPLFELGVGTDFIHRFAEMHAYKAVLIPVHLLEDAAGLSELEAYVAAGGMVIVTGDFMHKSQDNWRVYGETIERLNRLSGLRHEKLMFVPVVPEGGYTADWQGVTYAYKGFVNKSQAEGAQVLAEVATPPAEKGTPLVTRHAYGAGTYVWIAALPEAALVKRLLSELLPEAGIETVALPHQVELLRFCDEHGELAAYFITNKSGQSYTCALASAAEPVTIADGSFAWIPVGKGEAWHE